MMTGLNCGSASVPEDVPVAMLMVVGCYATSGLKPMRADERDEFMSVLDAVEIAMLDVPTSVSLITRLRFEATLKLMRASAAGTMSDLNPTPMIDGNKWQRWRVLRNPIPHCIIGCVQ